MQLLNHKKLHIVAGRATQDLANDICHELGVPLGSANIAEFANGKLHVKYGESIRGSDVFIIQTHTQWEGGSINDALMEHLIMVDAAKRASAKRITVVAPFYAYSRQDRKASGREPITARLVADLFSVAGADRLMSVDLHSGQIQGFFDGPVDHLVAMPVLVDYLSDLDGDDLYDVLEDLRRLASGDGAHAHVVFAARAGRDRVNGGRVRQDLVLGHQRGGGVLGNHEPRVQAARLHEERRQAVGQGLVDEMGDPALGDAADLGQGYGHIVEDHAHRLARQGPGR